MEAIIEGLLFVKGNEGLSIKELVELTKVEENIIKETISKLAEEYKNPNRGIKIELLGNKYKLTTKEEHKEYYTNLTLEETTSTLSQSALETLAIIAYNEPISRIDIDEIRGLNSSYIIRKLLLKNLIQEVGRSEQAGKPRLYGVTNDFLDYFGLSTIDDLPALNDVEEIDNEEENLFESKYKEESN